MSMSPDEVLGLVKAKVMARREGGNKVKAVTEIETLIAKSKSKP